MFVFVFIGALFNFKFFLSPYSCFVYFPISAGLSEKYPGCYELYTKEETDDFVFPTLGKCG